MSSSDSTPNPDSSLRPWHLLTLGGLCAVTVLVVRLADLTPVRLLLFALMIFAAATATIALYYTLAPLLSETFNEKVDIVAGRTRAAIEREKTLALRAIKELEFDHAMGKLSNQDFSEMSRRLRARARRLLAQLETKPSNFRQQIEEELAARLARDVNTENSSCTTCATLNDTDARFCKSCGRPLNAG